MSGENPGRYVLDEHHGRHALADDPQHMRREGSFVGVTGACAGGAERLAGDSAGEDIDAAPWSSVKRGDVGIDRSVVKRPVRKTRDQDFDGRDFPLNVQDRSSIDGKSKSKVEHSDAGADRDGGR